MAKLIGFAALSLLAGLCWTSQAGIASAQALDDQDCVLDTRFDPPRVVCRPRRGDRPGGILQGDAGIGRPRLPSDVRHWDQQDYASPPRGGDAPTGGAAPPRGRGWSRPSPSIAAGGAPPLQPGRALILPGEMPPKGVAAYGIVAFTTRPITEDRQRFLDVCSAYKSALIPQSDLAGTPLAQQMITFWPVTRRAGAEDKQATCDAMIDDYDIKAALDAIRDADQNKERYAERRGPFLIAWSPSESRASADSVILVIDMSDIGSATSFQETFKSWRQKIVDDPKFWRDGFSVEHVRLVLRDTLDRYGGVLLAFLPGKPEPKPKP